MITSKSAFPTLALGLLASAAVAQSALVGTITVQNAWSRETAVGQKVGGGFMAITNKSAKEDRLIGGSSPVAAEVQLHTMAMDNGVMRMRQVEGGITIPAKGVMELKPGSFHVMFMGLRGPLKQGEKFPVTLTFKNAGKVTVRFAVQPVGAKGMMGSANGGR